jgi:hypothetical protein
MPLAVAKPASKRSKRKLMAVAKAVSSTRSARSCCAHMLRWPITGVRNTV